MSDLVQGKLAWRGEKQKRHRVIVVQTKGGTTAYPVPPGQLSADLEGDEREEIEVEARRDGSGRPVLEVRPAGQEFKPSAATRTPAPQPRREAGPQHDQGGAMRHRRDDDYGRNRRPDRQQNAGQKEELPKEFHNPYNFIPAPDRGSVLEESPKSPLGDRAPSGHDCLHRDLFSGQLRVRLTVETPLLIPDTARAVLHPPGADPKEAHKSFPLRVGKDGRPHLPVTSVKGMLRAAYEAVTNSRLSVFSGHDEPLGFRMEAREGIRMVPARIEMVNGKECVVFYLGASGIDGDGTPLNERGERRNATMLAAWLPMYNAETCWISDNPVRPLNDKNRLPRHGEEVVAWVVKVSKQNYSFLRVVALATDEASLGEAPAAYRQAAKKIRGYVCNTGQNIKNKHDERVFFNDYEGPAKLDPVEVEQCHRDRWNWLIKDYRRIHDDGKGGLEKPPTVKKNDEELELEWSRHIQRTSPEEVKQDAALDNERLKVGTLCYARVRQVRESRYEVLELIPVIISRRLHKLSPSDLLPVSLRPAEAREGLSPADRVFGWVNQKGKGAYRGQLRIGTIVCKTKKEDAILSLTGDPNHKDANLGLPLSILGQPKPQQGRFYVAKDKLGRAQGDGSNNEQAGYTDRDKDGNEVKKSLRGRKVYPHHAGLPDGYWIDPAHERWRGGVLADRTQETQSGGFHQEYRCPVNSKGEDRTTQNRSVKEWVKKETRFEFDIHFTNLSAVELGALVWLLTLNEEGSRDAQGHPRYFRLGGGKPLGFGSVTLELAGCDVRDGAAWRAYYESLDAASDVHDASACGEGCCWEVPAAVADDVRSVRRFVARHVKDEAGQSAYENGADGLGKVVRDYREEVTKIYEHATVHQQDASGFGSVSFIAAFLRAATGHVNTKRPTHYPRARHYTGNAPPPPPWGSQPPHGEGLAYEWFVENNREAGRRYALADLDKDVGLPLFWHKVNPR